jgi:hypothetical protein
MAVRDGAEGAGESASNLVLKMSQDRAPQPPFGERECRCFRAAAFGGSGRQTPPQGNATA